ncbi:hypothetical protein C2G38_2232099 [Gigaspora rosea]|uniref:Uncharacterized protein n=1 Tax=Gigaspora rosea TaxID=44941 RepID=A0A397TUC2_9GLOM|nr:hypothetical protein C2G38_2232099 [Gigaspora rosea]
MDKSVIYVGLKITIIQIIIPDIARSLHISICDIDFETTYTDWELYGPSEILRTLSDLLAEVLPDSQTTFKNIEKVTTIPKHKRSYKCRHPSFIQEYFDKTVNSVENLTENLITHFRNVHRIVSENDKVDSKKELIDQLINLLMPFEEITQKFSGNTYVTLSRVIPKIKEIIFDLASEEPSSDDLFSKEDTIMIQKL